MNTYPTKDAKTLIKSMPSLPGVYRMLDEENVILYVGKARNLKKRVASYFRKQLDSPKTQSLMNRALSLQITITQTDNEALLLEANLIKEHRPRYNIMWRDDKSYPYIFVSTEQAYPRLNLHRGSKAEKGRYFGPYPSAGSVYDTLNLIARVFKLRSCEDSVFAHRSRPCLQYQIQRCTAPCVALVSQERYAQQVQDALLFLEGKSQEIIQKLADRMEEVASQLNYELASYYRDQIVQLRKIQTQQYVLGENIDVDIIATSIQHQQAAIAILFIRQGRLLGHKIFFLNPGLESHAADILESFIPQYYLDASRHELIPGLMVLGEKLPNQTWLEQALSENLKHKIQMVGKSRSRYREWLRMAEANAKHALTQHILEKQNVLTHLAELQQALKLEEPLTRIECFDVSHTLGESCVASCVVYGTTGALKSDYRRYHIEGITEGDDYAALRQVLTRRYEKKILEGAVLPDLILIDGGKGQLKIAEQVLGELQLTQIPLLAVAKGPTRKAGYEQLFLRNKKLLSLAPDSAALHLIQFIRDEAHRFAITAHRARRAKSRRHSQLETIPGIGAARRRQLLRHFGGLQQLEGASISEIAQVSGISQSLAQKIYEALKKAHS